MEAWNLGLVSADVVNRSRWNATHLDFVVFLNALRESWVLSERALRRHLALR